MSGFLQIPPLHPIFVHFPVALLPVLITFDLLGRMTGNKSLGHAGYWSLLAATALAPFSALTGWLWLRNMGPMPGNLMTVHQWLGTAIPVVLLPFAIWRYRIYSRSEVPSWRFLAAMSLVVVAITLQGHIGGMMTFGDSASIEANVIPQPSDDGRTHTHGSATQPMNMGRPEVTTQPVIPKTTPALPIDDGWHDSINVKGK